MIISLKLPIFTLLAATCCLAQNPSQNSPITILESNWHRTRQSAKKIESAPEGPVRMMTPDDKLRQRTAREQQTKGAIDPNDYTIDARSAALERNVQEARTPRSDDVNG